MLSKKEAIASENFQRYIQKADDSDVLKSIRHNSKAIRKLLKSLPRKKRKFAYDNGKWTIAEILQHIIDAERVFVYRALTFARKDSSLLPSFDENSWAVHANFLERKWKDQVEEFEALRASTESFFASLGEGELLATGTAGGIQINVLALGYVVAGHATHHIDIINERYLN
ncbi:MAG: DinB family protein [Gemmatimonadaceae bacterium]|nr:DinB family protein [Chitinophagaceae bacterium]